jgi:hypothetical protein
MYAVKLKAPGNPDFRQYAPVAVDKMVRAANLAGISRAARDYITDNDLGGGNFAPDPITKNGESVGRVSYNGKIWPLGEWTPNMQPIYDPAVEDPDES